MMAKLRKIWDDIWFRPASRIGFTATRVIVACFALWILASRPDLPSATAWPLEFWMPLPRMLLFRFGYFGLHPGIEWVLYGLLWLSLVAVIAGFHTRVTAFAAGLLLYHFAPLESILTIDDFTTMGGLTVPTIAMFAIGAAEPADRPAESTDYRWPVVLTQLLVALSFLLSGITKLTYVGWRWYTPSNIAQAALTYWSLSGRPAALWIATHSYAAWLVALGSAALDSLFVVAVFWRPARWIVVPLAIVAAVVRSAAFGTHWLALPLLLLFVDWEFVFARVPFAVRQPAHSG